MPNADREPHQLAIDEKRLEERVLRAVQTVALGIIVHQHVAVLKGLERYSCAPILMSRGIPPIIVGQNSAQTIMSP
jgi:hypothetical protein